MKLPPASVLLGAAVTTVITAVTAGLFVLGSRGRRVTSGRTGPDDSAFG